MVDGIKISPESQKMAELIPMKLKKKAGKYSVIRDKRCEQNG